MTRICLFVRTWAAVPNSTYNMCDMRSSTICASLVYVVIRRRIGAKSLYHNHLLSARTRGIVLYLECSRIAERESDLCIESTNALQCWFFKSISKAMNATFLASAVHDKFNSFRRLVEVKIQRAIIALRILIRSQQSKIVIIIYNSRI